LRKGIIQAGKFIAFLAVGILLLWLAFRNIKFKDLGDSLRQADYYWLILATLFGLFAYLSRARRWMILINPLGYHPTFRHTFYAVMSGYLANLALPRIGEITRCVALGKKEKIPVDQLIGTVVIERTIDFFSLMAIMVVLLISSGSLISEFLKASIFIPLQEKVFSVFGVTSWVIWTFLVLLGVLSLFLLIRYKKDLRKIRFFSKMFDIARGVINGLKTITNLKRSWEFVFHTIFIWVNYALMTWVVVFSLESTSHLSFGNSIFILVLGGLAMSAPVPGGFGAFHYFVSRGLAFVEGVKYEDGMAYAILAHESQLIFIVIVGTLSFILMFRNHHNSGEETS
jgi:uncharacterized protein (TIRG00374 family)